MVVHVPIELDADIAAIAEKRAKNTAFSPRWTGDEKRPPKDVTGVTGELALLRLHYGNWDQAIEQLRGEHIAVGLTDGGVDLGGTVDIKTTALYAGKRIRDLNMPIKADKCRRDVNYVCAFYEERKRRVYIVGWMPGVEVLQLPIRRLKADGPLNHNVSTLDLRDITQLMRMICKEPVTV
jgi:hypothetical protein